MSMTLKKMNTTSCDSDDMDGDADADKWWWWWGWRMVMRIKMMIMQPWYCGYIQSQDDEDDDDHGCWWWWLCWPWYCGYSRSQECEIDFHQEPEWWPRSANVCFKHIVKIHPIFHQISIKNQFDEVWKCLFQTFCTAQKLSSIFHQIFHQTSVSIQDLGCQKVWMKPEKAIFVDIPNFLLSSS